MSTTPSTPSTTTTASGATTTAAPTDTPELSPATGKVLYRIQLTIELPDSDDLCWVGDGGVQCFHDCVVAPANYATNRDLVKAHADNNERMQRYYERRLAALTSITANGHKLLIG